MKSEIITRQCLNPNFRMIQYNPDDPTKSYIADRNEFIGMVDRWKMILIDKYKVQPGKTILIVGSPNSTQYAATFAAIELGMTLVTEWPMTLTESDFVNFKVAMTEPLDFMITEARFHNSQHCDYIEFMHKRDLIWCKTIIYDDEFNNYQLVDHEFFKQVPDIIWATPETEINHSTSSGTTGKPKKVALTHKELMFLTKRISQHLLIPGGKTMHQSNIQHGWATLMINYLSGFIKCSDNYIYPVFKIEHVDNWPNFIVNEKINHVYLPTTKGLMEFLSRSPVYQHPIRLLTLGPIAKEVAVMAREKNIESVDSVFGDNILGGPFFLKRVTKDTDLDSYDSANYGKPLDDLYAIELRNGFLYSECKRFNRALGTSNDRFEVVNGEWRFLGRGTSYRINEMWFEQGELDNRLLEFFGDTVSASAVVDPEFETIYLAIWKPNLQAEEKFFDFVKQRFIVDNVNKVVSYVLRGFNIEDFSNERKVDNPRIRVFCRNQLSPGAVQLN